MAGNVKPCPVCGTAFAAPPSSKKVTCSDQCSLERKRTTHVGLHPKWNRKSRAKLAARGRTANLRLGTDAAKLSPIAGPFETNQEAKFWWLVSPSGERYYVRNLKKFIRDHSALFDGTVEQARAGLAQVQRSMQGKTKRSVTQWKGWLLERESQKPS